MIVEKDYTEIFIVLDNSGSMSSIKSDAEGGLKTFLETQKNLPGRCNLSLTRFSTDVNIEYSGKPIRDISEIKIFPNSTTALYDAVGKSINDLGHRLSSMPEKDRPENIIVCIVSDGMENASKEFNRHQIAEMIKHQESKYGWEFTFIGVGKDVFDFAQSINIKFANTMSYTATSIGTQTAYSSFNNAVSGLRYKQAYDMSKDSIN